MTGGWQGSNLRATIHEDGTVHLDGDTPCELSRDEAWQLAATIIRTIAPPGWLPPDLDR